MMQGREVEWGRSIANLQRQRNYFEYVFLLRHKHMYTLVNFVHTHELTDTIVGTQEEIL